MDKKKLYILTYEHGGYVLWKNEVKPRIMTLFEWMKKYPKLRIGLDYESFTFDEFSRCEPEVVELIRKFIEEYPDRVGLGATTYGQPLSLTISEESNVRQLTYAIRTNLQYFGKTPTVYAISEFALNNQTPQLIKKCGYEAAILRSHVMGYGYPRTFDSAWGRWIGRDGTEIPAVPTYDNQGRGYNCTTVDNWILSRLPETTQITLEEFEEMFEKYSPLLASRYDDLTQSIEPVTAHIETKDNYEYVLLEDIPSLYGEAKDVLATTDNDFHVQMPWGYCGNEIFNGVRKAEVEAVRGERLNALSVLLGDKVHGEAIDDAWKYALAAQHHDVTICGLLDLSRRFIPASLEASEKVFGKALEHISGNFAKKDENGILAVNTHSFPVDEWVETDVGEIRVVLPEFTVSGISACNDTVYSYDFNEDSGIITTPCYSIALTDKGIAFIKDKNGRLIVDNKDESLFSAYVDEKPCLSTGEWSVDIKKNGADATFNFNLATVKCELVMKLRGDSPRIDCKTRFRINNEKIGLIGDKAGLEKSITVNGHLHENKLCLNMSLALDKSRKMFRDQPYSVSEWNGAVRVTEDYWYKKDRIIIDEEVSPEESFASSTYLNGIYWVCLRDENMGVAFMNRGCMGSVVRGNKVSLPLVYSNEYMCGTVILDGVYDDEFSIVPFDSTLENTELHKIAVSYNYPPVVAKIAGGEGDLQELQFAQLEGCDDSVIMTAAYPENDYLLMRFCNYSDNSTEGKISVNNSVVCCETDLLGNDTEKIENGILHFAPWEIKTIKLLKVVDNDT